MERECALFFESQGSRRKHPSITGLSLTSLSPKLSGIIPEQVSDIIQESVSVLGKNMQFWGQAADYQ
jgi:hypothetical protein